MTSNQHQVHQEVVHEAPHSEAGPLRLIVTGVVLLAASLLCFWLGSPQHTGGYANVPLVWAFNILFAIGFICTTMGLMGAQHGYSAFVSGLVLYFIVGALVAVFLYVQRNQIGLVTLTDADSSRFWYSWMRVAALWPSYLAATAGVLDYSLIDLLPQ